MSITTDERLAAELYVIEAKIAGSIANQALKAFERLAGAQEPLKASSYDNDSVSGGGGHSDPVGDLGARWGESGDAIQDKRNELRRLIKEFSSINRRISDTLIDWASTRAPSGERASTNLTIWCANHLAYGHMEPRGGDGGQNCTWCRDIKSRYGKLPNKALIDLKGKRGKIDDATYRRFLGKKVA